MLKWVSVTVVDLEDYDTEIKKTQERRSNNKI